ncbi:MAG TPA: PilZ domain-containing protein [Candidatus Acidoferrales bacterium]|nr:PilZ domain-containing protein [Candidatus Acidoferrales bacterium]
MAHLSKTLTKTILPLSTTEDANDRRGGVRYQITVSAEVIELISGTRFSTRTTDLGPGGCFVDTLMPLPVGSSVRVRLHKDEIAIEALGTVTYSQSGLGMGVAFDNMPPEKARALDAWLTELISVKPNDFQNARASNNVAAPTTPQNRADVAQKLIRLLVKRGVISAADAAALLTDALL